MKIRGNLESHEGLGTVKGHARFAGQGVANVLERLTRTPVRSLEGGKVVKTRPCGTSVLRGHMLPLVIASADEAGSLPAQSGLLRGATPPNAVPCAGAVRLPRPSSRCLGVSSCRFAEHLRCGCPSSGQGDTPGSRGGRTSPSGRSHSGDTLCAQCSPRRGFGPSAVPTARVPRSTRSAQAAVSQRSPRSVSYS